MPRRYVVRAVRRAVEDDWAWTETIMPERDISVYETDRAPQPTGLLDSRGNDLLAVNEPNPIGFLAKID